MVEIESGYQFLKGTKHTILNNNLFTNLKPSEMALRLESGPSEKNKRKVTFSYKRIETKEFMTLLQNNCIPFKSFAIYELLLPTLKRLCKYFIVLKNWNLNKLSFITCQSQLIHWFLLFWRQHTLLKNFELEENNLVFVKSHYPEETLPCLHMIVDRYAFPSIHVKWVTSQFRIFLKRQPQCQEYFFQILLNRELGIVNERVYYKNGGLRLCNSCRVDDQTLTLDKYTLLTTEQYDKNPFVTQTENLICIPFYDATRYAEEEKEELFTFQNKKDETWTLLNQLLLPFQAKFKSLSLGTVHKYSYHQDGVFVTLTGKMCPFANREHKRSHLKLLISPWATSLECWSQHCKQKRCWMPISSDHFSALLKNQLHDDLHCDSFFKRNPELLTKWKITRYSQPIVLPYFDLCTYKYCMEASAMCTQKTRQCFAFIDRSKHFSFCWICPRISFCNNTYERLRTSTSVPFYLYGTGPFQRDIVENNNLLDNKKNVVIQYESIWKVKHLHFDVIIIDEITTVLSCVTSQTNKHKLMENATTFHDFLTHAKHVLLMDADLNAKALSLVQDFAKDTEQVHLRINSYRNPDLKKSVLFYMDRPKRLTAEQNIFYKQSVTVEGIAPGKTQFLSSLKKRLLCSKQRIVFITGSINFFESELEPWLVENKIGYKWYKQNRGSEEDLKDINQSWSSNSKKKRNISEVYSLPLQLVAFTNRITVGLSYEICDFDSIYIYGTPGSVIPRLLMQMRGRIRLLKEPTIAMYIFQRSDHHVFTHLEPIWNHVTQRKNLLSYFRLKESSSSETTQWIQDWKTWLMRFSWVSKQFCYHELEQNLAKTNFLLETIKQLMHNEYPWIFHSCYSSLICNKNKVIEENPFSDEYKENYYHTFAQCSILRKDQLLPNNRSLNGAKSRLFYQFSQAETPRVLEEKENKLLWRLFQLQGKRSLWKMFLHNWFMNLYPQPKEWSEHLNYGSIFHIGQEFAPKNSVRYHILFEMILLLGFKNIRDYESVISTRKSFATVEARDKMTALVEQYEVVCASKEKKSTWRNLPGLIRKISNLLKGFSGQTLAPYCSVCNGYGPCDHLDGKTIKWIQYKTKDSAKKKIKLYCFTYRIQPSEYDSLNQEIQHLFPRESQ